MKQSISVIATLKDSRDRSIKKSASIPEVRPINANSWNDYLSGYHQGRADGITESLAIYSEYIQTVVSYLEQALEEAGDYGDQSRELILKNLLRHIKLY